VADYARQERETLTAPEVPQRSSHWAEFATKLEPGVNKPGPGGLWSAPGTRQSPGAGGHGSIRDCEVDCV